MAALGADGVAASTASDSVDPDTSPNEHGPSRVGRREGDDTYPEIARPGPACRVIECGDAMQWIVQRRSGLKWIGVSFHRNRDVLIARCAGTFGPIEPSALTILKALPEWHGENARR